MTVTRTPQVESEDRKNTYLHLRQTIELRISLAHSKQMYYHLTQVQGKRQAVAGLCASATYVFNSLRVLDYRSKGPKSFTELTGVPVDDIPADLKQPELPGDEGMVGRLNDAAKGFYKEGNMLAAVAVWRAALLRLQVYQSGQSPASFLCPCLDICAAGIAEVRRSSRLCARWCETALVSTLCL